MSGTEKTNQQQRWSQWRLFTICSHFRCTGSSINFHLSRVAWSRIDLLIGLHFSWSSDKRSWFLSRCAIILSGWEIIGNQKSKFRQRRIDILISLQSQEFTHRRVHTSSRTLAYLPTFCDIVYVKNSTLRNKALREKVLLGKSRLICHARTKCVSCMCRAYPQSFRRNVVPRWNKRKSQSIASTDKIITKILNLLRRQELYYPVPGILCT